MTTEPKPKKTIKRIVKKVLCRCGHEYGWRSDHASFCPLHEVKK